MVLQTNYCRSTGYRLLILMQLTCKQRTSAEELEGGMRIFLLTSSRRNLYSLCNDSQSPLMMIYIFYCEHFYLQIYFIVVSSRRAQTILISMNMIISQMTSYCLILLTAKQLSSVFNHFNFLNFKELSHQGGVGLEVMFWSNFDGEYGTNLSTSTPLNRLNASQQYSNLSP